MAKKARKKEVNIEIDKLTNSIENVLSGDVFDTEFHKVSKSDIKKKDWLFDWHLELKNKNRQVYKMTIKNNAKIIQGLISFSVDENFIFINLVENAKFNRGKNKIYVGVAGNMFAFACKVSKEKGFGGIVSFVAKTLLINHYYKTLGATTIIGQRMIIEGEATHNLINQYFKNK
ncbi:MAG: hypothetical protein ABI199_00195 [Bacteroidia bacterium]